MHAGLFCINREGRDPNSHSDNHRKAANHPGSSLTHSLRLWCARASDQPKQTLTNDDDSQNTRTDFPDMLSHKSEHHNADLRNPPLEGNHFCVGRSFSDLGPNTG
jgi:hypothetical protein